MAEALHVCLARVFTNKSVRDLHEPNMKSLLAVFLVGLFIYTKQKQIVPERKQEENAGIIGL